ncbi:MAG TPA: hypothetical protein VL175_13085 [Pirellulales bacterium]|nr:hypothetical protein [Pirellulales bacterium]
MKIPLIPRWYFWLTSAAMALATVLAASAGNAWHASFMGVCTGFSVAWLWSDILDEKMKVMLAESLKREEAAWKMVDEWRELTFDAADRAVELKKELDEAATRH